MIRDCIDLYIHMLADTHSRELRFLEVSKDPDIALYHSHQRLAWLNSHAGFDGLLSDHAIGGRGGCGVLELELCVVPRPPPRHQIGGRGIPWPLSPSPCGRCVVRGFFGED